MDSYNKGFAPLLVALIVALGLIGGTVAGYGLREEIKQTLKGKTTTEEIKEAVERTRMELKQENAKDNKFEIEGVTTSVDVGAKTVTVKIKSSTDSIKELRLSQTPVTLIDATQILFGDKKDLKIADIPIDAKIHVHGTIIGGKLTANKIEIQKESADQSKETKQNKKFEIEGIVKAVSADGLTVSVASANKLAQSLIGKDAVVKIAPSTIIEKQETVIALSEMKVGDKVGVEGTMNKDIYTASKIEVDVEEEGVRLKETNQKDENETDRN